MLNLLGFSEAHSAKFGLGFERQTERVFGRGPDQSHLI